MVDVSSSSVEKLTGGLLLALTVALPAMDLEVFRAGGKSIVLPWIVFAALAVAVAFHPSVLRKQLRESAVLCLLAWAFVAAASSTLAFIRTQDSLFLTANLLQLATMVFMAGHYIVIAAALRLQSDSAIIRVRNTLVLTACAGALLTFYQFGSVIWGWPYSEWLRTSNLYSKSDTLNMHGGGSWISFPRPFGSAPEPTFWAGYMMVALAFAAGKWTTGVTLRGLVETALITGALILTFSRSAMPALVAMGAVGVIGGRFCPRWLVPAIVLAVLGITVAPVFLDERSLTVMSDRSALERLSAHVTGLYMVADYPLLGIGPGSTPLLVDRYALTLGNRTDIAFLQFYSFLLIVVATTGIIGSLCFAGFLFGAGHASYRHACPARPGEMRGVALSCLMAFAGVLVYWVSSPAYNMSFLWFALAFGAGLPKRDSDVARWRGSA